MGSGTYSTTTTNCRLCKKGFSAALGFIHNAFYSSFRCASTTSCKGIISLLLFESEGRAFLLLLYSKAHFSVCFLQDTLGIYLEKYFAMELMHSSFSLLARQNTIFCCGNRCSRDEPLKSPTKAPSLAPPTSPVPSATPSYSTRIFENKDDLKHAIDEYAASKSGPPPNEWDVSRVNEFSELFFQNSDFNEDISAWDTSAVTSMRGMFFRAAAFNQSIGDWDTSTVADMSMMFEYASTFNQDIGAWDTSAVTDMSRMFADASAFNRDISAWDTTSVNNMRLMFEYASTFDQDIRAWNVSSVTNLFRMFRHAYSFNQDISAWDVSAVNEMRSMFDSAAAFNQSLCPWRGKLRSGVSVIDMFTATPCAFDGTPSLSGDVVHMCSQCEAS